MEKARKKGILSAVLCFALLSFNFTFGGNKSVPDGEDDKPKKDTARAVVTYGSESSLSSFANLSEHELGQYIDSLHCATPVPYHLLEEVYHYQNLSTKSIEEIAEMIDSLFDLEKIPYGLINEINMYITHLERQTPKTLTYFNIPLDTSVYPANYYYNFQWDHRHPWTYSNDELPIDSTIAMQLTDTTSNCGFSFPVGWKTIYRYHGTVTSDFGWRDGRNHNGIDLELHKWDSVMTIFPGMVRMARNYEAFGNVVIVRHYNGFETLYAHLSTIKVKEGQILDAGDLVGLGGSTGNASGSHLHMEIRFLGEPIDPEHIIDFDNRQLIANEIVIKGTNKGLVAFEEGLQYHTIQRGDSPYKIAKRYGLNLETLCEINGITSKTKLIVGEKFKLGS